MVKKGEKLPLEVRRKISKSCKARWDKDRTPRRPYVPVLVPHCPGCKTPAPPEGFVGKRGQPVKRCSACLAYHREYYHRIQSDPVLGPRARRISALRRYIMKPDRAEYWQQYKDRKPHIRTGSCEPIL